MNYAILLILTILLSLNLHAADFSNKLNALSRQKLFTAGKLFKDNNIFQKNKDLEYPFTFSQGEVKIDMLLKINSEAAVNQIKNYGGKISSRAGNILAVTLPLTSVENILSLNNVVSAESSKLYSFNMDKSKEVINAEDVKSKDETILGGEGVIVGVFDTGIDFTHPDFNTGTGSRILKLWDMSDPSSQNAPEGYDYGREYTKNEIDNNASAVVQKDYEGHGTHVAGTAAGNGNGSNNFRGIAYNSDLIVVKGVRTDLKARFTDNDIISGCQYIFNEADKLGKPAVINLSLGSLLGPHDGKGLLSQALTSLVSEGRIIVASAGNEGDYQIHAGGNIQSGDSVEIPIYPINICEIFEDFCPEIPNFYMTAADIWMTAGATDSIVLSAYIPFGSSSIIAQKTFALNSSFQNFEFAGEDDLILGYIDYNGTPEFSGNGDANITMQIHNGGKLDVPVGDLIWSIGMKVKKEGRIDVWAGIPIPENFPFQPLFGSKFFTGNNSMTFGSPSDGDSIICVGSFVTKNSWVDKLGQTQLTGSNIGSLSSFSSLGPDRNARTLPHVAAPGEYIFAAKSKDYDDIANENILAGDLYAGLQGTSMAAPHVTGAVALMLQVKPNLQYYELVDILAKTSMKDSFTGNNVNNSFGNGKLNVQAAITYLVNSTGIDYVIEKNVHVYPNPASEFISLEINSSVANPQLNLYDNEGKKVKDFSFTSSINGSKTSLNINVSKLNSGVYNADCIHGNNITKFRFVVAEK